MTTTEIKVAGMIDLKETWRRYQGGGDFRFVGRPSISMHEHAVNHTHREAGNHLEDVIKAIL